VYFLAKFDTS